MQLSLIHIDFQQPYFDHFFWLIFIFIFLSKCYTSEANTMLTTFYWKADPSFRLFFRRVSG